MTSSIGALVIAIVGVIGTLSASVISQVFSARSRREELEIQRRQSRDEYERGRDQSQLESQRQVTLEFILAADAAHDSLRRVPAQPPGAAGLKEAARAAVEDSGLYAVRENVLISVPPSIAYAAEQAFHSIIQIRDAVGNGSGLDARPYRDAYDVYAAAIWSLRQATRASFGVVTLDLAEITAAESARRAAEKA